MVRPPVTADGTALLRSDRLTGLGLRDGETLESWHRGEALESRQGGSADGEGDGDCIESAVWPFFSTDPAELFVIVKQWLDKVEFDLRVARRKGRKAWDPS